MTPQSVVKLAATKFLGNFALQLISKMATGNQIGYQCCCDGAICGSNGANTRTQPTRGIRNGRRYKIPEEYCSCSDCMEGESDCEDCDPPTRNSQRARNNRDEERSEIANVTESTQRYRQRTRR